MERLPRDIVVRNVDNTKNSLSSIHHKVYLAVKVNRHLEVTRFLVTNIGTDDIILGHTWLRKHNPAINWRKSLLRFTQCPPSCSLSLSRKWIERKHPKAAIKAQRRTCPEITQRKTVRFTLPDQPLTEEQRQHRDSGYGIRHFLTQGNNLEKDDEIFIALPSPEEALRCTTQSTELAMQENMKKEAKTLEQQILDHYLEYRCVFEEETS